MMETISRKTVDYSSNKLNQDLHECIKIVNQVCNEKNFVITMNGEEVNAIHVGEFDFYQLSKNRRKKIAKRMRILKHSKSRKNINTLLHFLRTRVDNNMPKFYVNKSKREQKIDTLRKEYKDLVKKTEEARVKFKDEKKGFYV